MAKKKSGVNKTASILEYKQQNPDAMPKAIAEALQANGVDVTAGYVSTILSKSRSGGGGTKKRTKKVGKKKGVRAVRQTKTGGTRSAAGASLGSGEVSVEVLMQIKEMANQMGGVGELRGAVDAYENLMNS